MNIRLINGHTCWLVVAKTFQTFLLLLRWLLWTFHKGVLVTSFVRNIFYLYLFILFISLYLLCEFKYFRAVVTAVCLIPLL